MKKGLPVTGERMLPEMKDPVIIIEHLHRYAMAQQFCEGMTVLDIACGEGYGSSILAKTAKNVIGVDIDKDAIIYAQDKYGKSNLIFKHGSTDAIPIESQSVDFVVSFETLEHHNKHEEMMLEIKRVLKSNGVLLISTPDKKIYSELPGYANPFHVKELYSQEFFALLGKHFKNVMMFGQSAGTLSILFPLNETKLKKQWSVTGTESNLVYSNSINARYLIAIASNDEIEYSQISLFYGNTLNEEAQKEQINNILKSRPYRLGNALLKPFRFIKNIFNRR